MKSLYVLLLFAAGLLACSPNPYLQYDCSGASQLAHSAQVPKPLSNLFPIREGTHWEFRNEATGDYTWFDFSAMPGTYGCSAYRGTAMMMHITKSAVATYWNPGVDAEVFQPEVDNGTEIWSPGFYYRAGTAWTTVDLVGLFETLPYPYLPDVFSGPGKIVAPYAATRSAGQSVSCLPVGAYRFQEPWTTYWYAREVTTPVYSGIAVASHQCETAHSDFEEVWLFAPGVGLVEIDALRQWGKAQIPPIVIKRQQ
jgi:hypothetical protein